MSSIDFDGLTAATTLVVQPPGPTECLISMTWNKAPSLYGAGKSLTEKIWNVLNPAIPKNVNSTVTPGIGIVLILKKSTFSSFNN